MRSIALTVAALSLVACAKKPTAMEVCKKIEVAGVGTGCRESKPEGLGAAAVEKAEFDLPSVPGKTGAVFRFDKSETFTATQGAFEKAAMLAGPHRYGSEKTLIFVQMNSGAPLEVGKRAKAVIDALPEDSTEPPVSTVPPPAPKAAESAPAPAVAAASVDAKDVCAKLVSAGVAKDCGKAEPGALEKMSFGIASMPGKNGNIVHITDGGFAKYAGMIEKLPPTSALRPFVASEKANVVVHLQPGASPDAVAKAKAVVEGL